ncbi:uncharacterized protein LOC112168199 isoform X2 [Rosa chinensis]|uniref:uncharacterized protein LOC112168199 isoform X2 n=1 Tax=Rosa chinensis TaxID=74649 RepID=UPI000D089B33|nr:uncharacterized protein LOC112168199 isoform X2 [Rosa chinensis]
MPPTLHQSLDPISHSIPSLISLCSLPSPISPLPSARSPFSLCSNASHPISLLPPSDLSQITHHRTHPIPARSPIGLRSISLCSVSGRSPISIGRSPISIRSISSARSLLGLRSISGRSPLSSGRSPSARSPVDLPPLGLRSVSLLGLSPLLGLPLFDLPLTEPIQSQNASRPHLHLKLKPQSSNFRIKQERLLTAENQRLNEKENIML